jgi:hypothetical protein
MVSFLPRSLSPAAAPMPIPTVHVGPPARWHSAGAPCHRDLGCPGRRNIRPDPMMRQPLAEPAVAPVGRAVGSEEWHEVALFAAFFARLYIGVFGRSVRRRNIGLWPATIGHRTGLGSLSLPDPRISPIMKLALFCTLSKSHPLVAYGAVSLSPPIERLWLVFQRGVHRLVLLCSPSCLYCRWLCFASFRISSQPSHLVPARRDRLPLSGHEAHDPPITSCWGRERLPVLEGQGVTRASTTRLSYL